MHLAGRGRQFVRFSGFWVLQCPVESQAYEFLGVRHPPLIRSRRKSPLR